MTERWFFALWPDPPAREALAGMRATALPPGARGTHPLDLHLTLKFLGPLDLAALERAEQAAGSLDGPEVPVRIDRIGWFPGPRVLWCGPAVPSAELLHLAGELEERLAAVGFRGESRPFKPHMTLARKVRGPIPARPCPPIEWTARELILAAGREGSVPRYRARRRWSLGPVAPGSAPIGLR